MKTQTKVKLLLVLVLSLYLFNSKLPFTLVNPLPSEEFRVLVVYETSDDQSEFEQIQAINSIEPEKLVEEDGGFYKRWDKDISTIKEDDEWYLKAHEYVKGKEIPYFVASKGNKFREGKINDLDEYMKILKSIK